VRYADDCNIYVGSERAGQRVMASVVKFIEGRMRLKVNMAKSAVARPEEPLDASRRGLRNAYFAKRGLESLADRWREHHPSDVTAPAIVPG